MTEKYREFWERLEGWQSEGLLPDWARDRQRRSRATREHILEATSALLQDRSFEEISVEEIATGAGVSVGALYARFPSKEAILFLLGMAVLDGVCRRFEEALAPAADNAGVDFAGLARVYVTVLVTEFRRHRRLIVELRRLAPAVSSLRRLAARTNSAVHESFLVRARSFAAQIPHTDPEACLRYALFAVNAAAREAILANALSTYDLAPTESSLVDELTRLMTGYVGISG